MATKFSGESWSAKYSSSTRTFRGYLYYEFEPEYSKDQSKVTITKAGVEKVSTGSTTWENGVGTLTATYGTTSIINFSKSYSSSNKITFDSTANSERDLDTTTHEILIDRGNSDTTVDIVLTLSKTSVWAGSGTGTLTLTVPKKKGVLRAKVSGAWKEGITKVKVSGAWKEAVAIYTKVNGTWKEGE